MSLRTSRAVVIFPLLLAFAASPWACRRGPARGLEGWNLLLLTLDTTRRDRLGCYGYGGAETPNLDRLADEGIVFDTAFAQAPLTLVAHASILTGKNPPSHGVRGNVTYRLAPEARTLAEILSEGGYSTSAVVAAFVIDHRFGLSQGFGRYDDDAAKMKRGSEFADRSRDAEAVTDAALAAARALDPKRPFFLWVHYFDPHRPYAPPPEILRRFPDTMPGRYDGEIAAMDRGIGRLLEGLERLGRMRHTLVVVVGDHGEGLGASGREKTHGVLLYDDTIRIPFLVHAPGALAVRGHVAPPVRQVDVLPTVLDLLGVEGPVDLDGRSLGPYLLTGAAPGGADAYAETLFPFEGYGWAPIYALRSGRWELIEAPTPELYDTAADPGERENLAGQHPDVVCDLRERLRSIWGRGERNRGGGGSAGISLAAEEVARLEALGYVTAGGGGTPAGHAPEGHAPKGLANPRDRLDLLNLLERSRVLRLYGRDPEALEILRRLHRADPGNYSFLSDLGTLLLKGGALEEAEEAFERLTRLRPRSAIACARLGEVRQKLAARLREKKGGGEGEADRMLELASRALERSIELGTPTVSGLFRLGVLRLESGRLDEAEKLFRRALGLSPSSFECAVNLAYVLVERGRLDEARGWIERAEGLARGNRERLGTVAALRARLSR